MIPYSIQNRNDVIGCHRTGKYYQNGICSYTTKTECEYRIVVKKQDGSEEGYCDKHSDISKKVGE